MPRDDSRIASLYDPKKSMPFSVLIGRNGKIAVVREGYNPGAKRMLVAADVEKELAVPQTPAPLFLGEPALLPAVRHVRACLAISVVLWALPAWAVDVGDVAGQARAARRYGDEHRRGSTSPRAPGRERRRRGSARSRTATGQGWINRLNSSLRWGHWDLEASRPRLGRVWLPARGWRRPNDATRAAAHSWTTNHATETRSTPQKLWATYSAPGVEVIEAGDAYVQFGRGLDALDAQGRRARDRHDPARGGKVQITRDPFSVTFVAGFGNPSRVDEATGARCEGTSARACSIPPPPPLLLAA